MLLSVATLVMVTSEQSTVTASVEVLLPVAVLSTWLGDVTVAVLETGPQTAPAA